MYLSSLPRQTPQTPESPPFGIMENPSIPPYRPRHFPREACKVRIIVIGNLHNLYAEQMKSVSSFEPHWCVRQVIDDGVGGF